MIGIFQFRKHENGVEYTGALTEDLNREFQNAGAFWDSKHQRWSFASEDQCNWFLQMHNRQFEQQPFKLPPNHISVSEVHAEHPDPSRAQQVPFTRSFSNGVERVCPTSIETSAPEVSYSFQVDEENPIPPPSIMYHPATLPPTQNTFSAGAQPSMVISGSFYPIPSHENSRVVPSQQPYSHISSKYHPFSPSQSSGGIQPSLHHPSVLQPSEGMQSAVYRPSSSQPSGYIQPSLYRPPVSQSSEGIQSAVYRPSSSQPSGGIQPSLQRPSLSQSSEGIQSALYRPFSSQPSGGIQSSVYRPSSSQPNVDIQPSMYHPSSFTRQPPRQRVITSPNSVTPKLTSGPTTFVNVPPPPIPVYLRSPIADVKHGSLEIGLLKTPLPGTPDTFLPQNNFNNYKSHK